MSAGERGTRQSPERKKRNKEVRKYGAEEEKPYFRISIVPYSFLRTTYAKVGNSIVILYQNAPSILWRYLVYYYCHRLIDLLLLIADQKQTPSLGAILEAVLFMCGVLSYASSGTGMPT